MTFTDAQIKKWLIPPEFAQYIALRKKIAGLCDLPTGSTEYNKTITSNIRFIKARLDVLQERANARHEDWFCLEEKP